MPSDEVGWEELPQDFSTSSSSSSICSLSEEGEGEEVGIAVARPRRSFSYYRLPETLLRLSVLKLDGSSFDVEVARSASVLELKMAVEGVFKRACDEDGGVQVSWSHVWGHFCLGYEGHKLIDDKMSLRNLGIKDGDQLHFMRHLSINYNPTKRNPRNFGKVLAQHSMSSTGPEVLEEIKEDDEDKSDDSGSTSQYEDEDSHDNDEDDDLVGNTESRLVPSYRGVFSYSRLLSSS